MLILKNNGGMGRDYSSLRLAKTDQSKISIQIEVEHRVLPGSVVLTPTQARHLASELNRWAGDPLPVPEPDIIGSI